MASQEMLDMAEKFKNENPIYKEYMMVGSCDVKYTYVEQERWSLLGQMLSKLNKTIATYNNDLAKVTFVSGKSKREDGTDVLAFVALAPKGFIPEEV